MNKTIKTTLALGLTTAVVVAAAVCPNCRNCNRGAVQTNARAVYTALEKAGEDIQVTAKAAFLVEANSGRVLFSKDETKRLPIASMVKITTLAVIYDALEAGQLKMTDKIMVSKEAAGMGGSQAFLDFDSEYLVEDLIKSIIIASANDSCVAMAEAIAGSETEFVTRMNDLAARLGMENTNYVNCTGLPAAGGYSCAADVAKVYQYLMKSPFYAYKSGDTAINLTWMYDMVHPSGRITGLTNTNKHARFFNGCAGGKTGYTAEAGHCITVTATRGQMRPVAVIIGASDSTTRFAESGNLLNHVFSSYENKIIVDRNKAVGTMRVKGAMTDTVEVFAKENFFSLVKKGDKTAAPTVNIQLDDAVRAPATQTTAVGKIVVTENGNVVREIDVVPASNIEGIGYFGAVKKIARNFKL